MTSIRKPETLNFTDPVSVTDDELKTVTVYKHVSSTISYPAEASTEDQMNLVEASGTLDFWNHPEEGVYDNDETGGDAN